jgi:hypothetical protein
MFKKLLICLVLAGFAGLGLYYIAKTNVQNKPVPMNEVRPPELKGSRTVMGHISGQQLSGDDLRLMVCTDQFCNNISINNKTEIIVTNLNGRREVNHNAKSLFDLLEKYKDCKAAVGIDKSQTVMVIIYIPD